MSLTIVGFAGRPVSGAAGIKAPLVRDIETGSFAVYHGGSTGNWWTKEQIAAYEEQALLTRISEQPSYEDGVVIVYAHREFVAPSVNARSRIGAAQLQIDTLLFEPKCECYVGIFPVESATAQLDKWGRRLLDAARAELEDSRVTRAMRAERAWREVLRARFTTAGRDDGSANRLRREAAVLGWATLLMSGADDSSFRADTAIDFGQDEVLELERETSDLLLNVPRPIPSRARTIRLDLSTPPYRYLGDSA